jgi:hypothetical protein
MFYVLTAKRIKFEAFQRSTFIAFEGKCSRIKSCVRHAHANLLSVLNIWEHKSLL